MIRSPRTDVKNQDWMKTKHWFWKPVFKASLWWDTVTKINRTSAKAVLKYAPNNVTGCWWKSRQIHFAWAVTLVSKRQRDSHRGQYKLQGLRAGATCHWFSKVSSKKKIFFFLDTNVCVLNTNTDYTFEGKWGLYLALGQHIWCVFD